MMRNDKGDAMLYHGGPLDGQPFSPLNPPATFDDLYEVRSDDDGAMLGAWFIDDGLENRLCTALEPVLIRYGIPAFGLPLGYLRDENAKCFIALGDGDRGDLSSDLAQAAIAAMDAFFERFR